MKLKKTVKFVFATHGYPLLVVKRVFYILLLAPLLLLFFTGNVTAAAPEDILSDFADSLPDLVQSEVGDAVGDAEATGELVGAEYLMSLVLSSFGQAVSSSGGFFMTLAGALILFALTSRIFAEASEDLRKTVEFGLAVVIAVLLFSHIGEDMARTESAMTDMCKLVNALSPAYAGLFLAEGGVGTAAASSAGFAAFTLLLENLAVGIFLPLLRVLLGFTLIGVTGTPAKTDGIFRSLRHTYVTVLVFLSLLLTASLGFQTSLASSADSLSARSVKFALGQMIPVIGGSLSETWRVLSASLGLLRNSIGVFAVVSLFLLILPTFLTALLHRFALSLSSSLAGILGCPRAEKIFTDLRGIYDLAVATLAITLVLFLLTVAIVARCTVAVGV